MSTGVGMSSCCLSGKLAQGTPKGRYEEILGLDTYISEPESGSKAKSIVFISDIFGYRLKNVQLLADNYAAKGFYVYVPDFLQGGALPESFLQDAEPPLKVRENLSLLEKGQKTASVGMTLPPWLITHREGVVRPLMEGFFNHLRYTPGTNKIGTIGFCWGGRYALLMTHEGDKSEADGKAVGPFVDAAVACHPSLVSVPADFEPIARPVSIAVGDKDSLLSNDEVDKIKDVLALKPELKSQVIVYEDQVHGFALRGDWSSEKDKEAMDKTEEQGVEWFNYYL